MQPPSGNVTFLFTDIERSSQLWEQHPQAMGRSLARHDGLMRDVLREHGGYVFKTMGDAFCVTFSTALDAVNAAVAAQQALQAEAWDETGPLKVRMALHSGESEERDGDYFGQTLNRVARLLSIGHGGQTLLSRVTAERVREKLPREIGLRDLGERRLKDLSRPEQVFQVLARGLPAEFPALRTLEVLPNNLPAQVTGFVGREREMAEAKRLLSTTRLLTLLGPGGTGKTRLGVHLAAEVLEDYAHGVWLVEFATLSVGDQVPEWVAAALEIQEQGGRDLRLTLQSALRERRLLLLLDNCEHLIEHCAGFVETMLRHCPNLRCLVTSREALKIPGEKTFHVPSLSAPRVEASASVSLPFNDLVALDSVQLFVERAAAVRSGFTLTPENAALVAEICWRLDGIPLAIELAAARVKVLTPAQILTRLDDRFHLLSGGSRTAQPRQQAMSALIDWSYELLSEAEKTLLRRLSVFVAGRTLEAAEKVCAGDGIAEGEILDLLESLSDKSLISVEADPFEVPRYMLLESIWDYSWEKLQASDEAPRVRDRHLEYFLAFALAAEDELWGPQQREWLDRVESEIHNFRHAVEWCLESGAIAAGLRLGSGIVRFFEVRSMLKEGAELFESLLAKADADTPPDAIAKGLFCAGRIAWCRDRDEEATRFLSEALRRMQELGWKRETGLVHIFLGLTARNEEQDDVARSHFERVELLARETNEPRLVAGSENGLGSLQADYGDIPGGRARKEKALSIFRTLGDKWIISNLAGSIARIAVRQGDLPGAAALSAEALKLGREIRNRWSIPYALEVYAQIALASGEARKAACLYAAATAHREAVGLTFSPAERRSYDDTLARIRESVPAEVLEEEWTRGLEMPTEPALALAQGADYVA